MCCDCGLSHERKLMNASPLNSFTAAASQSDYQSHTWLTKSSGHVAGTWSVALVIVVTRAQGPVLRAACIRLSPGNHLVLFSISFENCRLAGICSRLPGSCIHVFTGRGQKSNTLALCGRAGLIKTELLKRTSEMIGFPVTSPIPHSLQNTSRLPMSLPLQ